MEEVIINSFSELHNQVQALDSKFTIFRGVTNADYQLLTTAGRMKIREEFKLRDIEKFILKTFKERAVPYLEFEPKNDWEWLAVAQHHGLPTRLLDWTRNALVAAYFAVRKEYSGDSAIYVIRNEMIVGGPEEWDNPLDMGGLEMRYIPSHVTQRIIAQNGLFTFHPEPSRPFEHSNLLRVRIPQAYRRSLKRELYNYGIHEASMFPGLDGLATHISWMNQSCY